MFLKAKQSDDYFEIEIWEESKSKGIKSKKKGEKNLKLIYSLKGHCFKKKDIEAKFLVSKKNHIVKVKIGNPNNKDRRTYIKSII